MNYDHLLRPGKINQMELPHRIITGPMEKNLAARDGTITVRYLDYLLARARGGAGLIQVESTYVDTIGMGHLFQLGCHGDHVIEGLAMLAEKLHAEGAKVGLELYLGGRQTPSYMSQRQPISPSVVVCEKLEPPPVPRAMNLEDIKWVIACFAAAARRVKAAGLDMIHIHGAHGYLLCQFLSPYSNRRNDEFGGPLENRARLPIEVYRAIREVVGNDFPIGYRFSAEEFLPDGLTIEQTAEFAAMLSSEGIDLLDVSGGLYESFQFIIQGPEMPRGGFVENAVKIKQAVGDRTPVSVAQRLNDPAYANEVLRTRNLDFISLTRAFHADPEYVNKLLQDRPQEIRHCIACHYCTNLLELNAPCECSINPATANERMSMPRPARQSKDVVVIGGGPGGMEAACQFAERGHRVTLLERAGALGGQVRFAAQVAPDYANIINYHTARLGQLGVTVRMNTEANVEIIRALEPDAVIVATGARNGINFWPVKGTPNIIGTYDVFARPDEAWEERVVIAGGDFVSVFQALYIAGRGAEVIVIEPGARMCYDKHSPARDLLLLTLGQLPTVTLRTESTIEELGEGYVRIQHAGESETLDAIDAVVIGGRRAEHRLAEQLLQTLDCEVVSIGDCVVPREIYFATHEAAAAAREIHFEPQPRPSPRPRPASHPALS